MPYSATLDDADAPDRSRYVDSVPALLHEIVAEAAASDPDGLAVVFGTDRLSFAELDDRVNRLAGALRRFAQGGDRVAIVSPNVPAWIECYYAVPLAGLVVAFVNHRLSPAQMIDAIAAAEPAVLIGGPEELADMRAVKADLAVPTVVALGPPLAGDITYESLLAHHRAPPPTTGLSPDDTAWLIATSGTSGTPKQVELSHRNLLAAVRATASVRTIANDDTYLFPFPLCHVAGYNVLLFHRYARPMVLLPRFDPELVVQAAATHEPTVLSVAPTMLHVLVDHLESTGERMPTLRSISYGASPITPSLLRRADAVLGTDFNQGYGMTELAGNAVFLDPEDHRRGLGGEAHLLASAGRPNEFAAIRIIDDGGHDVMPGSTGEIAVRGDQVMKGYWRSPEANRESFAGDWLRTGDIGRIDQDGYLFVIDRKKDVIITGGENVSSREVEDALATHPDVGQVAVIGVPDPRWGESVCAVVVPRDGSDLAESDVIEYGRTAVGGFKKPTRAIFIAELPRNPSGKILKRELRAMAAKRLGT